MRNESAQPFVADEVKIVEMQLAKMTGEIYSSFGRERDQVG